MIREIAPFHAMAIGRLAHSLAAQGRSVIHMEYGQPSTGAPSAAIAAAHRILDSEAMGYWESAPLKARIARHYAETQGATVRPEQVILTCGASPSLVLALTSAFAPGARVAFARPGYVAYRNTVAALGMEPVEIPCGAEVSYQLTATALAALDPAPDGVIIASPANPTGTIVPREELGAIARVCAARGIRIISDEIYHGLSYGLPTISMLAFEPGALVVNSFSKYFSMTGWRVGWVHGPKAVVDACTMLQQYTFVCAPQVGQWAALAALDSPMDLPLAECRRKRDKLMAGLRDHYRFVQPGGAFYLYPEAPGGSGKAFAERAVEREKMLVVPGSVFGQADSHFRIAYTVSDAMLDRGIAALRRLAASYA